MSDLDDSLFFPLDLSTQILYLISDSETIEFKVCNFRKENPTDGSECLRLDLSPITLPKNLPDTNSIFSAYEVHGSQVWRNGSLTPVIYVNVEDKNRCKIFNARVATRDSVTIYKEVTVFGIC